MNKHTLFKSATKKQNGAVLVVSLLILLVLTLIGVSSMDGSIMEEKMASNSQTASATFQKADSAIREALFIELANPANAVNANRDLASGATARDIDRSNATITSSTQHRYTSAIKTIPHTNSSTGLFVSHPFQIIGSANVGGIRNSNIQGYKVGPLPR